MPNKPKTSQPWTNPNKLPEKPRKTAAERGYGSKWQRAREGYLAKSPICVICLQKGKIEAATELDHIIPHRGDMVRFWDATNWQSLCKSCHSKKTAAGL